LPAQCVMAVSVPADASPPAGLAGLGVLSCEISPCLVDEVIGLAGCREKRRRLLPARAVVYFVLGLCLFSGADSTGPPGYRSVMRWLTSGVRHLHGLALPTSSALTRARQRLGAKPLELLFDLRRGVLAGAGTPGAFAFGLRLAAWDGTCLDAADTPANAGAFGVARTQGGNPQVRLLALTECGTHALIDAVFDGVAQASEQVLARRLLASLAPGMLLLADRNFPGHQLWGLAAATGAELAWRIKKNLIFPPVKVLPDGSFHSIMRTPAENVRHWQARAAGRVPDGPAQGHLVRVIEYTVTAADSSGGARTEPFRLVTTLLDHEQAPAAQLAALYHQRWESENSYGELKTRLRGASFILPLQIPRTGLPGAVRVPHRLPGPDRPEDRSGPHRRDRPGPDLLHRDRPHRPRPRQQPGQPHRARLVPGTQPGHPGHPRRSPAQAPGPAVPAHQETAEKHLPGQETRPGPPARQRHIQDHRNPAKPPHLRERLKSPALRSTGSIG
jgi:hypothetical protein